MASHSRTAEREEERRLNMRTLVIASVASAAAALLTSRLSTAGTWIAAAMTPVIVSLVSEMLHRPTERIAKSLTSDRRSLAAAGGAGRPAGPGADPLAGRAPMEPSAGVGEARPPSPGLGSEAPIRVYRAGEATSRSGRRSGRDQVGVRGRGPGGRGQEAGAGGGSSARGREVGAGGGPAGERDLGAGGRGGAAGERDLGAGGPGVGAGAAGQGAGGVGPGGRGREPGGRGTVLGAPGIPPLERRPVRRRRRIAFGAVFATAALAFVIAVAALTLPELVAGGSVGKSDGRTTFFGGGGKSNRDKQQAPQDTTPEERQQPEEQQEPRQPTTPEEETTPSEEEPPPAEEAPPEQAQPGEPLTETTPAPPPAQP
jgi:hypothetical protein